MNAVYPPVLTGQYKEQAIKWLDYLRLGENASVIFFPQTDRLRRLNQLFEDKVLLESVLGRQNKYLFQIIDLNINFVEDSKDFQEHVSRQLRTLRLSLEPTSFEAWMDYFRKNNIRLVLVLMDAERYITPVSRQVFEYIFYVTSKYSPTVSALSVFEQDITHPSFAPLHAKAHDVLENTLHYPLYSADDTLAFIRYLEEKWSVKLPKGMDRAIVNAGGGHFWLVKEAVREFVSTGSWSAESEGMQSRLSTIFQYLLPSEQSLLAKSGKGKKTLTSDEEHSLAFFQRMRIYDTNGHNLVRMLGEYARKKSESHSVLTVKESRIFLNDVPVDKMFSKKEYRVLKGLLESGNGVISRDQIAGWIWPTKTQEQYSDWAIDQTIARLRKRLTELDMSPDVIKSVRGKGYTLELEK